MTDYNHPNMSYVAFENTSSAMEQILFMLEVADEECEPLTLDKYEGSAFRRLVEQCKVFLEVVEQSEQLVVTEE